MVVDSLNKLTASGGSRKDEIYSWRGSSDRAAPHDRLKRGKREEGGLITLVISPGGGHKR
jgi:hypothetical protein